MDSRGGRFAIVATFEIAPGRMDAFLPLLLAHRDRCLRDEPGTLRFDVLWPRHGADTVMLYELYEDEAAFTAHWNGPSVARLKADSEGMIAKLTGIRCSLVE